MPRSVSDLSPRGRPRLRRTLKRNPYLKPVEEEDLRWLWAAYRRGSFPTDVFRPELDVDEFEQEMKTQILASSDAFIAHAVNGGKKIPVGIFFAYHRGHVVEPHAAWFSWATPRNMMECWVKFVNEFRKHWKLLLFVMPETKGFFGWICRHGILKPGSGPGFTIEGYFARDHDAVMFYSKDVKEPS